uniref:Caspase 14 n=1 Tax=Microcebus murinus TaxID=30608 RepID=A0A8C5Y4K6_MICMU
MSDPQPLQEEAYDMSGARLALTLCVTKAREGSEADLRALERMFRQLRFRQAMDGRDGPVSCAFVVLMAHGYEGFLKGQDGRMVELDGLFQALNNRNCRALRAKPKVYIIQACRGERRDPGETVGGEEIVMITPPSTSTPRGGYELPTALPVSSWVKDGSCFIQTLVDVFTERKGPILELLTEVTRRMAEAEVLQEGKERKVNPEILSTLRKQLYLQ